MKEKNSERWKNTEESVTRSRIHERTISLRLLGVILRVLRLQVYLYNVYITNQFKTTFAQRRRGGEWVNPSVDVTVNSKEENSWDFFPNYVQEFCLRTGQQFRGGELGEKLRGIPNQVWLSRARICKRLWSPGIDSEESIPLVYVAWRGSTTKKVVVSGRFLGSLKGLQILAQASDSDAHCAGFSRNRQALLLTRRH